MQAWLGLLPRRPLGCARNLVPHDRADHLEPLPRNGLQGLAVRHAPVAAARVVVAPSVAAARKAVAGEHERARLELLQGRSFKIDRAGCSQKAAGKVVARWLSGSSDSGCVMPVFPRRFSVACGGGSRVKKKEKTAIVFIFRKNRAGWLVCANTLYNETS